MYSFTMLLFFFTFRKRIVNENGVGAIEHYMYEEHELLRPAAVECMCNLVMCEEVRIVVTASITILIFPTIERPKLCLFVG